MVGLWGTWEELILGGAVVRHGTRDWDVVASELRIRTVYPAFFTPEACKAKYADLQRRFSGSTDWFEELRKCRVAELKQELERSEDSIEFLESKLKRLKAEKENCDQVDYDSSRTESPVHLPKIERTETCGKDTSKDELSAGSFTQDIRINWLSKVQIPPLKIKIEIPESCELEKSLSTEKAETEIKKGGTLRRRRGKRKRKDSNWDTKEGSLIESENLGSANFVWRNETSTSGCGQTVVPSSLDVQGGDLCRVGTDDLVAIFNSVTENKYAMVFRRRLDSQKRARYRKTIMQHMDMDTIRSRIATFTIKTARELFRDLLLIANNGIVFYSKRTREYKSAVALREIVTEKYREHYSGSCSRDLSPILCFSPVNCRPRSIRPRPAPQSRTQGPRGYLKLSSANSSAPFLNSWMSGSVSGWTTEKVNHTDSSPLSVQSSTKVKKSDDVLRGHRKPRNEDANPKAQSTTTPKKSIGRPRKIGGGRGNRQKQTPVVKERKRSRQK